MASLKDDVQKTILGTLRASPSITSLVSLRVYEEPPATPASPYIVAGDARETGQITMGGPGYGSSIRDLYFPLYVYYVPDAEAATKKTYYQAARGVADAIEALLHKQAVTLTTSGWTCIACIKETEQETRNDDGTRTIEQIYHLICHKADI